MNLIAISTIVKKELLRTFRVPGQTLGAPIITTLLYFLVFSVAIGRGGIEIAGLTYNEFIMPGLIMMNVVSGSYGSVSSAIMISKMMNTLSDMLVSPMSYLDIVLGYSVASMIRSLIVASLIYGTALFFVPFHIEHLLFLLSFVVIVGFAFALLGMMIGIWADSFEQSSVFPTFLLTPLSFLGGIFYSIENLPDVLQNISRYNPLLYMINGMRYGFYGVSDVNPWLAFGISIGLLAVLTGVVWNMFRVGYKIRN